MLVSVFPEAARGGGLGEGGFEHYMRLTSSLP